MRIGVVELVRKAPQIFLAQSAIELVYFCARKQVVPCAIAIQVQAPEIGGKWRLANVADEKSHVEAFGQLAESGDTQDMPDVAIERAPITRRVIHVETIDEIVADIARICVRSEELQSVGKTFLGTYPQTVVGRAPKSRR